MPRKEEYRKNPEHYRAYNRTYMKQRRIEHPARYDADYQKRWREQHPNYMQEWRGQNRDRFNKLVSQWRKTNPERFRELKQVYDRIRNHPELYPLDEACVFCGSKEDLEHGHLDYEDEGYNYVTACHQCNLWMFKQLCFISESS